MTLRSFWTARFPSRKGVVERFEGNSGMRVFFCLLGGLLLAFAAYTCAAGAEQVATLSLLPTLRQFSGK